MNTERPTVFRGRAWILRDEQGTLLDDIDTDQIYHNAHLAITDVSEMGRHALGNLSGWEDFPEKAAPGDIVMAGSNFGAGSSRQHAVDCFLSLGIAAMVARSFAPIYKRNAINSGFPILACDRLDVLRLPEDRVVEVRFLDGQIVDPTHGAVLLDCRKPSDVQLQIYAAGDLFSFGATMSRGSDP
jgi:3-isopropylmalate/(R)-2-methylmalate dehydratase small subunit